MGHDAVLSQAMLLLREADVRISGGNMDALSLTLPESRNYEVKLQLASTPPTPSKLKAILERKARTLIVTVRPTPVLLEAAIQSKLDLITLNPATVTIAGVSRLEPQKPTPNEERTPGRTAWGRWALLRAFALADTAWTQQELASAVGISQPAVNKHLKVLGGLVKREQDGWKANDIPLIVDWLTQHYPGPRGVSSYWYSLKPSAEQAEAAAKFAGELGAAPLISGDAAADIYAPWRLPDRVHLYLREAVDFTDAGFGPASPEDATMIATVPEDPTLWATAALCIGYRGAFQLADPLVTLQDVLGGDGVDSEEAAEHLRDAIVSRSAQ